MEDDRGRSTADTFNNIKKMELGALTIEPHSQIFAGVYRSQSRLDKESIMTNTGQIAGGPKSSDVMDSAIRVLDRARED
ncbi:hypothetical protein NC653_029735 [Populus alba x Populus x berolinensis]|uniref:Uncharacterized protein n=1 Tax=Populus alba x Populus x berolinensis TaxID=444605 RepID=A0AAD6M345_9ROSI|nr:hypothetical protein NC653_029735 [Populus alba x Populus x berolinensis]